MIGFDFGKHRTVGFNAIVALLVSLLVSLLATASEGNDVSGNELQK